MKRRLVNPALAGILIFAASLGLAGCGDRKASDSPRSDAPHATRDTRERAEAQALRALAGNPDEIRRRVNRADIEVPETGGTRVHLVDGRGQGPGTPPAWNVELRSIAGIVPGERGLDVFADLAIHHALKPPECYLILLHLDSIEAVYTSAVSVGEGARVVSVRAEDHQGDVYDLEVDYLGRAPQGDFVSNPTEAKKRVVKVAHHSLGGATTKPVAPH